ncbi:invasion associated locus B family protein [Methylovirgula sp. 4M-Z18]|nr:invasion associated locus B family protein [Methylovirgula sp. 4M-Z18]
MSALPVAAQQSTSEPLSAKESLPGGATALQERHDDWTVSCSTGQSGKNCGLLLEQVDANSHQRALAIELHPAQNGVQGTLILPFGLVLDQGAIVQIDNLPPTAPLHFHTCLPAGCVVMLDFDAKALAALRGATALKVKAFADGGKEIPFTIPLKGFPGGFDRTNALMK